MTSMPPQRQPSRPPLRQPQSPPLSPPLSQSQRFDQRFEPQRVRLQWRPWNLLLLVPLLILLTPLYNRVTPRLFGMPFFYWFQLAAVFLGVALTALVYVMTKDDDYVVTGRPDRLNVDSLDEGAGR